MLRAQHLPWFPLLLQRLARSHSTVGDYSCPLVGLQGVGCCDRAYDSQDDNQVSMLQLGASLSLGRASGKANSASSTELASIGQLNALLPTRPDLHDSVALGLLVLLDTPGAEPKQPEDSQPGRRFARPIQRRTCLLQNGTLDDPQFWNRVLGVKRLNAWSQKQGRWRSFEQGVLHFFGSAEVVDWTCFVVALVFFLQLHRSMLRWPATKGSHGLALLIWMLAGAFYNSIIWARLGSHTAKSWLTGYWLELIFSIENVFIFQVIAQTFRMSWDQAQKALIVVVCCQLLFQMIFYMGLAEVLIKIWVLPYLLGAWLIWMAFQMLKEEDTHTEMPNAPPAQEALAGSSPRSRPRSISPFRSMAFRETNRPETDATLAPCMVGVFKGLFGDRFVASYSEGSPEVFSFVDGRWHVTLLLPAICCLLVADFMMEIDVTLTKIMEIQQPFIAFTSSMAAAFAVPDLFFVAQDLLQHFRLLKYGVAFVLFFFGGLLLLHRFVRLHDMVCLGIVSVIMVICMLVSHLQPPKPNKKSAPEQYG